MDDNNKKKNLFDKLFSTQGILIVIAGLMVYWLFFDNEKSNEADAPKKMTYNAQNAPVGVSPGINQEALDKFGLDLSKDLDPKLVPALVEEAMKETAQAQVTEEDFFNVLVSKVSTRIQEISTIDLNDDGRNDPVMVIPQNFSESGEHFDFSIRVPDPEQVTSYPSGSDQEAWQKIAKEQSFEIMTTSVVRQNEKDLAIQTQPNQQLYQGQSPYYHRHTSFTEMLFTGWLISSLFRPPFYSPFGFGGGMMPVTNVRRTRAGKTAGLNAATASTSPTNNKNGRAVSSKPQAPNKRSLDNVKSRSYSKQRQASARRRTAAANSQKPRARSASPSRSSNRGFGSRSRTRGGFGGGFGRRGGFRRR